MEIGNPKDLKLNNDILKGIESTAKTTITKLLGPKDSFIFTCTRSGRCCRNRTDNPIILNPYDILRLSRNRKISTGTFLKLHTTLILGHTSHLPLALLKYEGNELKNKCPFLRSYGCLVYNDRPLRCRLYPLGRIITPENKSYFFLQEVATYCNLGKGQSHTTLNWIKKSGLIEYFNYGEDYTYLKNVDLEKYKALPEEAKLTLAVIMYDIDRDLQPIPEYLRPKGYRETMKQITKFIRSFFKLSGCMKSE